MVHEVNEAAVVADLKEGFEQGIKPSKVMRYLFEKHGTVPPPIMAEYYEVAFGYTICSYYPLLTHGGLTPPRILRMMPLMNWL